MKEKELIRAVEAMLFAVSSGISEKEISNIVKAPIEQVKNALRILKKEYDERGEDSALLIINEGTTWRMVIKEKYMKFVSKIIKDIELPRALVQTLAVIAWKSPVQQAEIIKIRGSVAYAHIKELEEKGFIRREKKGNSYLIHTTDKFKEYFEVTKEGELREILSTAKPKKIVIKEKEEKDIMELKKEISKELATEKKVVEKILEESKEILKKADEVVEKVEETLEEVGQLVHEEEKEESKDKGNLENF